MRISNTLGTLVCLSLLVGCSRQVAETATVQPVRAAPPEQPTPEEVGGTIAISEEIREICGIADTDAYFAFDSARINKSATKILREVATCFGSGPLAGRQLSLVGHADPRGEGEYNMALGERRASAVSSALERLGLGGGRTRPSSRGEMDATGTNEASWAHDRRVDVALVAT